MDCANNNMLSNNINISIPHSYPIPQQLRLPDARFIKVAAREKTPVEKGWQNTKNYRWDDPDLIKWISEGGNYGVLPRGFTIIDIDDIGAALELDILENFSNTLTVKSGSGKGLHIYIKSSLLKTRVPCSSIGKTDHIFDIYGDGAPAFVVGSGSTHPSGNKYVVTIDTEMRVIFDEFFEEKLLNRVSIVKSKDTKIINKVYKTDNLTNELNLRVSDFLYPINAKCISDGEYNGSHPTHGSDTGTNFSINTNKNVWHCWRHNTGGDPVTAFAVSRNLIRCEDCVSGYELPKELFLQIVDMLGKEGYKKQIAKHDAPIISQKDIDEYELKSNPKLTLNVEETNFFYKYIEHMKKKTHAYPDYFFGVALSIISAVVSRNAHISLLHEDIYPNIWAFMLGVSGISNKSTSIRLGKDILDQEDLLHLRFHDDFTPEGLMSGLHEIPSCYMFIDECSAMLGAMTKKTYMSDLREKFCELYECQTVSRRLRKEVITVKNPYITMILATTPDSFEKTSCIENLTSGWFYRYLWFYPNYNKKFMRMKQKTHDILQEEIVLRKYIHDLWIFFDAHKEYPIKFQLSEENLEYFNVWIENRENEISKKKSEIQSSLYSRLQTYALKIAMCLEIGSIGFMERADAGVIEISTGHLKEAIRLIDEYFFPMGIIVCHIVENSSEQNLYSKVVRVFARNGGVVQRRDLLRNTGFKSKDLSEIMNTMINEMNIVEEYTLVNEDTKKTYILYKYMGDLANV